VVSFFNFGGFCPEKTLLDGFKVLGHAGSVVGDHRGRGAPGWRQARGRTLLIAQGLEGRRVNRGHFLRDDLMGKLPTRGAGQPVWRKQACLFPA